MNLKRAKKIEVIGLGILLLAAGMHMFTIWNQNNLTEGEFYRLNERITTLWYCNREILKNDDILSSRCSNNATASSWYKLESFDEYYKSQVSVFNWIYIFLYFGGSIMLLIGKYNEFSSMPDS